MFAPEKNKKTASADGSKAPVNHSPAEPKSAPQPNTLWQTLALRSSGNEPATNSPSSPGAGSNASTLGGPSEARFHSDDNAASAAEHYNASAFTVGRDVFFGRNQFTPGRPDGDRLIRHELAHVAQANYDAPPHQNLPVAAPNHPAEVEADHLSSTGGHAAVQVTAPTVFRHKVTPTPVARLDKDHIFGNAVAVPPLPGINLGEFQDYTEQTQADWFVDPTLLPVDRKFLWEMLLMIQDGAHIREAIGDVKMGELHAVAAGDRPALKAFCRGHKDGEHTIRFFPPLPPLADRIALGHALIAIEAIIQPDLLEVTVSEAQLQRLQASPPLMALLVDYWAQFEPFLEESFTPAPGKLGPEFERVLAFLTSILGSGLAPLLPLQGASAKDRWVRDLHRFPLPMLNQLVANLGDTSGKHPLLLILQTGHDSPAAFVQAASQFSDLAMNVGISTGFWPWQSDLTNLVLMIEGPTSLSDMTARVPGIAATWGHDDGAGTRKINQVLIAGHGSGHSVSLAGVGPPQIVDGEVIPADESMDTTLNLNATTDLLDALFANMDPATARVLYAGCLVGTRTVPANTPAAGIPAAIAADQSLGAFTESRAAAAATPIPVVPGETVQAARGSVGIGGVKSLYDPATGFLKPDHPGDPTVFGTAPDYAQTGVEPEGVLRAAVEVAATLGVVPAETMLRTRMMMPPNPADWYDRITRMLVPLVLPPATIPPTGVDIKLVNEMANAAEVPFLVVWPDWIDAIDFVTRLNPQPFAADVYAGLMATPEYTALSDDDEKRMRVVIDQGNFARTLVAADLLSGILASGLNAAALTNHIDVSPAVLGGHEAALMPLVGAPTVEQIRLALAWFARDPFNAHVSAFLTAQVAVAAGVPPAFNAAVDAEITAAGLDGRRILTDLGFRLAAPPPPAVGGGPPPDLANVRIPGSALNAAYVSPRPYIATVTVAVANVRPSPSQARDPIGTVKLGNTVNVAGFTHDWAAIDFNGKLGFIHKALITPP
jgi:Domain of unknown function (DUF4157)